MESNFSTEAIANISTQTNISATSNIATDGVSFTTVLWNTTSDTTSLLKILNSSAKALLSEGTTKSTISIPDPPERGIENEARYLDEWLKTGHGMLHGHHNIYILYSIFGVVFVLFLLFLCWTQCCVTLGYQRLPSAGAPPAETTKGEPSKARKAGRRDDDFENTFVGVSVPLLQDVTKI